MLHKSKFFDNVGQLFNKYPNIDLRDLFSKGQMKSKRWLVDELLNLNVELGTVFICAGWYGSLATFLFESNLSIDKIRSFDIDPSCANIADTFNRSWVIDGWKFKASTLDVLTMTYPLTYNTYKTDGIDGNICSLTDYPNTIINTSCEHMADFENWYNNIPAGTLLILQNNNYYDIDEHVNCAKNIDDFTNQIPMQQCLFLGELVLPKYNRFMKIGIK